MKRRGWVLARFMALGAVTLMASGCTGVNRNDEELLNKYEETCTLMDTFVTITVYTTDEDKAQEAIDDAFLRMEEIENRASIFEEGTEATRLNREGMLKSPSEDFRKLIELSLEYSQGTDGYFDITVQPLLELWQSGLWQESKAVQENRIEATMNLVGWDKVTVGENAIELTVEGMKITLGGIAKGYAVDEALDTISDTGIEHALINAGGDMRMLGTKPQGEPWRVALVNPDNKNESLASFIMADGAIATSGNYERYFDPEKKAHHIINPKTGYSASECISTTVIAPDLTYADALATGIFVMGPEDGIGLINSLENTECFIVDSQREIHQSSGISRYLAE